MRNWPPQDRTITKARALMKRREDILRERREFESTQPLTEGTNFQLGDNEEGLVYTTVSSRGRGLGQTRCYFCRQLGHKRFECEKWKKKCEKAVSSTDCIEDKEEEVQHPVRPVVQPKVSPGIGRGRGGHGQVTMVLGPAPSKSEEQAFSFASPFVVAERTDEEEMGFCFAVSQGESDGWVLDTGATHHLSCDIRCLRDLKQTQVRLMTGMKGMWLPIAWCGTVTLDPCCEEFKSLMLQQVLFSHRATTNILAVKPLVEAGCSVKIVNNALIVLRGGTVVLEGRKDQHGLYVLSSHGALEMQSHERDVGAVALTKPQTECERSDTGGDSDGFVTERGEGCTLNAPVTVNSNVEWECAVEEGCLGVQNGFVVG